MIDPGLAGRTALVTGANQGIGAAVAEALARQGVHVFLAYKRLDSAEHAGDSGYPPRYGMVRAATADAVLARVRAAGVTAEQAEADLTDADAPRFLFDAAERAIGPVQILVNNASGWLSDTFRPAAVDHFGRGQRTLDAASHRHMFAVDAMAPALLIAEFARRHIARHAVWGRIIGLTSGGSGGFPGEVSYGAAKAAQENYTLSAAAELRSLGITANMVHPPATDTGWVTDAVRAAVTAEPGGRIGVPEDVAELIVYLASEQARHVSGQVIKMS